MDVLALLVATVKTSWLLGLAALFLYIWRSAGSPNANKRKPAVASRDASGQVKQDVSQDDAAKEQKGCCGGGQAGNTGAQARAAACACKAAADSNSPAASTALPPIVRVLYGSTKGTCRQLASDLAQRLDAALAAASAAAVPGGSSGACCGGKAAGAASETAACCGGAGGGTAGAAAPAAASAPRVAPTDLSAYEPEGLLSEPAGSLVVVLVSTYEGGTPPENARFFCSWLEDAASDFRLGSAALSHLRVAVWGAGNSLYEQHFNAVARRVDTQLRALGASSELPLGLGDEDAGDMRAQFATWRDGLVAAATGAPAAASTMPNGRPAEGAGEEQEEEDDEYEVEDEDDEEEGGGSEIDMEDIGGTGPRRGKKHAGSAATSVSGAAGGDGRPEMLNPLIRGSLTKQGYKLIGSHSGVKMCRWTKSMLRGRGGCYKHAFYGIASHRCMEATPSLACANKCVFCWRHHSNPVGKTWKWAMDPPDVIVDTALELHTRMVREYAGVPGVKPEAVAEGLQAAGLSVCVAG
ncbi:hypothetical protein GPECTOR_23g18 [Gonium pectorale]|uniref:tRNA 4-demethylwyosine synthase (AdoMet-dependent) n=1 Tax=Gonium pectorale TaxID=33097 RepID=A0A150GHI9_GONPE|nr:hypothetical protein GPECTOR_23g18 [Gonium pectorale]|eukprot:KXZ49085.1 hypothetical protein GPECTOR_23g18 [Gonium pectorale]